MTFDKSRVYTALNADELKIGSKCFFANCLSDLMDAVKNDESERTGRFTQSLDCDYVCRFRDDYGGNFALAYLIELPKYEAFESIENAMEAIKAHGGWVIKTNNIMSAFLVTEDDEDREKSRVFIDGYWYSLQELCRLFVFADDDTPCGELVEER